jgi:hypothetical protein
MRNFKTGGSGFNDRNRDTAVCEIKVPNTVSVLATSVKVPYMCGTAGMTLKACFVDAVLARRQFICEEAL